MQEADAQPQEDSVDTQEPAMTSSIRNDPTGRSANRDSKKEEEKKTGAILILQVRRFGTKNVQTQYIPSILKTQYIQKANII